MNTCSKKCDLNCDFIYVGNGHAPFLYLKFFCCRLNWSLAIICFPDCDKGGRSERCIIHLDSMTHGHDSQRVFRLLKRSGMSNIISIYQLTIYTKYIEEQMRYHSVECCSSYVCLVWYMWIKLYFVFFHVQSSLWNVFFSTSVWLFFI
jgi:hypothetical protein